MHTGNNTPDALVQQYGPVARRLAGGIAQAIGVDRTDARLAACVDEVLDEMISVGTPPTSRREQEVRRLILRRYIAALNGDPIAA